MYCFIDLFVYLSMNVLINKYDTL